jgi:hypothetical protein
MEFVPPPDEIEQRLAELETRLRDELADCAQIERSSFSDGRISMVSITPKSPSALAVSWIEMHQEIILTAGHEGGRWELGWSQRDVDFVQDVVWSVVTGRAVEVFAPKRSHVKVTLASGKVVAETGWGGCLTILAPIPGWRRFGRKVQYSRYQ